LSVIYSFLNKFQLTIIIIACHDISFFVMARPKAVAISINMRLLRRFASRNDKDIVSYN
jgi:hypothetical protein